MKVPPEWTYRNLEKGSVVLFEGPEGYSVVIPHRAASSTSGDDWHPAFKRWATSQGITDDFTYSTVPTRNLRSITRATSNTGKSVYLIYAYTDRIESLRVFYPYSHGETPDLWEASGSKMPVSEIKKWDDFVSDYVVIK